ncbi:MAG: hypothetical protein ABIB97_03510 [Patescibacteria group bacterium]
MKVQRWFLRHLPNLLFRLYSLSQVQAMMIKDAHPDHRGVIWQAFCSKVTNLGQYMVLVNDDRHQYHRDFRFWAGCTVLNIICEGNQRFLPEVDRHDPNIGQIVYLSALKRKLPDLGPMVDMAVYAWLNSHERRIWCRMFNLVDCPDGFQPAC